MRKRRSEKQLASAGARHGVTTAAEQPSEERNRLEGPKNLFARAR
jgi:hypothetical protein